MSWNWSSDTLSALSTFMQARGLTEGSLQARRIGDGHSNLTFLIDDGKRQLVLRRPPPPPAPPGAHDVLREARVIGALAGSDVPVPTVLAVAKAGDVLDVPFYVMSYLDGVVITSATPAALATSDRRNGLANALIDGLASLHAVDWRTRGLSDFGRPEGFNRRHVKRIASLVTDANSQMPPAFAELHAWLDVEAPRESDATIVHNDYRLGNVMWAKDAPPRLLAVLDWELATLGDPLLDVGYLLASCPQRGEPMTPTQEFAAAMLEGGYPNREALADRYATRTSRDLIDLHWYIAMSQWKLAVLYEYSRRRGEDPYYADVQHAEKFLASARRFARL